MYFLSTVACFFFIISCDLESIYLLSTICYDGPSVKENVVK